MYNIARLSTEEREIIFRNTAFNTGINPAVVEKDYWVCLVLDYLFHFCSLKSKLVFKGGTSLSKAFHIIERFSEDIDLILDWRLLGYCLDEPWEKRSRTKQLHFIHESRERLFSFLRTVFLPEFKAGMKDLLGCNINAFIDAADSGTVIFEYPHSFTDPSILHFIRLEIGALAAWSPAVFTEITPFTAVCYPELFTRKSTIVLTASAERTFWEKATILHQEAFRPDTSSLPDRYSRHYYDIYCMNKSRIKQSALKHSYLLKQVAEFKDYFYPRKWARYELAKIGTLRLTPASHSINRLQEDYSNMRSMIFGECPSFESLYETIHNLEMEINNLLPGR